MTRYKGRPSSRAIEAAYPHHVEVMVPKPFGLGNRLNRMQDWHTTRGIRSFNGQSRFEERNWERYEYVKWCFADAETADAFAAEFGGERV